MNVNVNVTIISRNAETLGELARYLIAAGIQVRATRSLEVQTGAGIVVLFPDEYELEEVRAVLMRSAQFVIVTSSPKRFEPSVSKLVVAKPAWAWLILDAIRNSESER